MNERTVTRLYEGGLTLERASRENGFRNGGDILVRATAGESMVDFHISVSGIGGAASVYQQLRPDEAHELAAALTMAAEAIDKQERKPEVVRQGVFG